MAGDSRCRSLRRKARPRTGAYVLVVRGRDGRVRSERFADAASYRARVAALEHSHDHSVSLDDIITLLTRDCGSVGL
jgi:hypothetical protein